MKDYTKQQLIEIVADRDRQISDIREDLLIAKEELNETKYVLEYTKKKAEHERKNFETIENSKSWKITKPVRSVFDSIKKTKKFVTDKDLSEKFAETLKKQGLVYALREIKAASMTDEQSFKRWMKKHKISDEELSRQRKECFEKNIVFSILVPLYNTPEKFLREMIDSVIDQTYAGWELCLADGSDNEHGYVEKVCRGYSKNDRRIKYKKLEQNLGISGNTNACLDMATGEYIALFDHDDILHPSALYEMMGVICEKNADIVYTDEVVFISPNINKIKTIHFKPDFAPDNLKANNYMCHFTCFRRSLIDKAGLFRSECDGSQDHDLMLRITEKADVIEHIPKVLYYWRAHPQSVAMSNSAKGYASEGGKKAVLDSIERMGMSAIVFSSIAVDSIYRIRYKLMSRPKISIVISNYGQTEDLYRCIKSIVEKTTYDNYEIIVVDDGRDRSEKTQHYYEEIKREKENISIVPVKGSRNIAASINYGVTNAAKGEYILLLDGNMEVISPAWIEEMLMYAQRNDVGAVGAKIYYPDNTIKSGGIILGRGGTAAPAFQGRSGDDFGYMGRLSFAQNLSAVSGECMMIRRKLWDEVKGLDEEYSNNLFDVDLCMRIREARYLIVWTPYAELYCYVSEGHIKAVKDKKTATAELDRERFKSRWFAEIEEGDPYYNPNLSLDVE